MLLPLQFESPLMPVHEHRSGVKSSYIAEQSLKILL